MTRCEESPASKEMRSRRPAARSCRYQREGFARRRKCAERGLFGAKGLFGPAGDFHRDIQSQAGASHLVTLKAGGAQSWWCPKPVDLQKRRGGRSCVGDPPGVTRAGLPALKISHRPAAFTDPRLAGTPDYDGARTFTFGQSNRRTHLSTAGHSPGKSYAENPHAPDLGRSSSGLSVLSPARAIRSYWG